MHPNRPLFLSKLHPSRSVQ